MIALEKISHNFNTLGNMVKAFSFVFIFCAILTIVHPINSCTLSNVCHKVEKVRQKQDAIFEKVEQHDGILDSMNRAKDEDQGKMSIFGVVHCTSMLQSREEKNFKLEAFSPDKREMCRTFGQPIQFNTPSYRVSADLLNQVGWLGIDSGHLGLLYNAVDENNFDFVYFRPHSTSGCYQTGYMSKGSLSFVESKNCPGGPPRGALWFHISIQVRGQEAQVFYNESLVTTIKTHFSPRPWGGVFTFHGYQNVVRFRDFQLVPRPYVSQACAKIVDWSNYVMLDANHGSWPNDSFCRVMYVKKGVAGQYQLTVELFNFIGWRGVNSGHLGVLFNAQDENNFDFVYFRPHSTTTCFQTGYVYKGEPKFDSSRSSACPHGPPTGAQWFQVKLLVAAGGEARLYLNTAQVAFWSSRYPVKNRGGVLVANGYKNVIYFRNFLVS